MGVHENFKWSGYKWLTRERWGTIHPDKPWMKYAPDMVYTTPSKELILDCRTNPYDHTVADIGLVSSIKDFLFGTFEIECILPTLPYAWPAFWLWGGSWPPEIDVFEGYANSRGGYCKPRFTRPLGFWNVQTNLHYGDHRDDTNAAAGSSTHWFGLKNPRKNYMRYKCEWTPEHVKIWYNGRLVRTFKDNVPQIPQQVILNNGITHSKGVEYIDDVITTPFIVKWFKHEEL